MRRTLIGWLFILHGLAHSALGFWAASLGPAWVVTPLWWIAQVGFVAAGAGLIGVDGLRRVWAPLVFVAGLSSIGLFNLYGHLALSIGLVLDVFLIAVGLQWGEPTLLARLRGRACHRNAWTQVNHRDVDHRPALVHVGRDPRAPLAAHLGVDPHGSRRDAAG